MKPLLSFMVAFALITTVAVMTQQPDPPTPPAPAHAPEPCNRIGGFDPDGTRRTACQCQHQAHQDGEECVVDVEDSACAAWCRHREFCGCPVSCAVPADSPAPSHH